MRRDGANVCEPARLRRQSPARLGRLSPSRLRRYALTTMQCAVHYLLEESSIRELRELLASIERRGTIE